MVMRGAFALDGLDISADMLAVAAKKGLYRKTIVADLSGTLNLPDSSYGAVVSSGTFTHGHVGPDALDELLRIAKPGAIFVLSINAEHFDARGFGTKFTQLGPSIRDLTHRTVDIYGESADAAHRQDQALIAVFRKR
jgi:SAM-dependent methyltransferase